MPATNLARSDDSRRGASAVRSRTRVAPRGDSATNAPGFVNSLIFIAFAGTVVLGVYGARGLLDLIIGGRRARSEDDAMEPQTHHYALKVLVSRENGGFVAQGINYNLAAQGRTIADAQAALGRLFVDQVLLDLVRGAAPLGRVAEAPAEIKARFDRGEPIGGEALFGNLSDIEARHRVDARAEDVRLG